MPGTLTIAGSSQGLVSGAKVIGPITMTASNTIGEIIDTTLNSGDNTFQIPVGAGAVLITTQNPPTVGVTIRTNLNATDVGLPIAGGSAQGWFVVFPIGGESTLIINAGGTIANVELSFI